MLDKLERKFRRFAIANLTIYLVAGQALFFLIRVSHPDLIGRMVLVPEAVLAGQWWRVLTFLFIPPFNPSFSMATNTLFLFFGLYVLYLMGTALENHWGTFRYNLYVLIGYLASVGVTFAVPDAVASNGYLLMSIFLAFAFLYPDFVFYLFLILPVKVKWLAAATWIGFAYAVVMGSAMTRWLVLASVLNFALFFGRTLIEKVRGGHRRMRHRAQAVRDEEDPFHRCEVCGKTDQTDPEMEFRYCPACTGAPCYCMDHINDHEHK